MSLFHSFDTFLFLRGRWFASLLPMSLGKGASITSMGGSDASNSKSRRCCKPLPTFLPLCSSQLWPATSPAAATVAVANSSTVQAVVESSSSNVPAAAAAVEPPPFLNRAAHRVALLTSTQSTISTPSTSNPDANQAIVPITTSATDQVVAAPQNVLSTPTPTYSPITSPKHASNARGTIVGD